MKRFLRLTQEAVLGTYASGGTAIWIRLDQPGSFKPMTTPRFYEIMSGSGFAVPALTGSAVTGLAATLSTPLHYSQWAFLMGGALTRINGAQTVPWTTSEAIGDLASFTADFAWSNFDGTLRRKRFKGCKIASLGLSGNENDPVMRLSLGLVACTPDGNTFDSTSDPDATALPEPADSSFPTDPVLFQHLKSGFTIASSRTNFSNFSFSVQNKLKAYFDEGRFANAIRLGGRSTKLSTSLRLKASPDDRAAFEAATLQTVTSVFTNGTNTGTLTLNTKNRIDGLDEGMPLDEEIYYDLSVTNLLDTTATTDFTIAYA